MKHIEIRHLYLQELLRRKVIPVEKINTKQNPADLGTKKLTIERRRELFKLIGIFQNDHETQASRIERQQSRRVQSMLFRAFQAATVSAFQGCSSTDELDPAGESPTWTKSTRLMCMAYFVLALAVAVLQQARFDRHSLVIYSSPFGFHLLHFHHCCRDHSDPQYQVTPHLLQFLLLTTHYLHGIDEVDPRFAETCLSLLDTCLPPRRGNGCRATSHIDFWF